METVEKAKTLYPVTLPPGAGITQFLMNELKESKIPAVVVTYFTEAGDNCTPAFALAESIFPLLSKKSSLKTPWSWKKLYGEDSSDVQELF